MNRAVTILLWAGLLVATLVFGYLFSNAHGRVMAETPGASQSSMLGLLFVFVLSAVGFALLSAYEIGHFLLDRAANWAVKESEPEEEVVDPSEEAERLRMNGDPLEAIRLLRAHLEKYPDDLKFMARIAEMYKDELNNPLAAALEYEELLRRNPPAEQWGWAALHLAKLYERLGQREKALELLSRLQAKHGETLAARRARKILGELEEAETENPGDPEAGIEEEPPR